MTDRPQLFDELHESNDPFGMSRFSIRRYSIQQMLLILSIIGLLAATNVQAALYGNGVLMALAGTTLGLMLALTALVAHVGIRVVAVEVWIRRLGMGDLEYRIEPWGNDEVSKSCEALETLRQSSIRAMKLDLVQKLSDELQEKNAALEHTLEELRKTQDQIISQQKLAELGELSAGVAHQIRNPLQFIRNFAKSSELIVEEVREISERPGTSGAEDIDELTGDLGDNMGRIIAHSDRADRIVMDMLAMGRRGTGTFGAVDLNRLLSAQASLAHQAVQAQEPDFRATVREELAPDLGDVIAVEEDIARVITNLVTNACHAMAERARDSGNDYQPELRIESRRTPEGAEIEVRDNGVGMAPEVTSKIFNPFFTTKEGNRNTGLGLSLSYDIVREHGGQIVPASEPGEYTAMTVRLPRDPRESDHSSKPKPEEATTAPPQ